MAFSVRSSVQRIDHGWREMQERARKFRDSYVKVGVVGSKASETHPDGVTNAALAAYHEFGTPKMPARPFVLPSILQHRPQYIDMLRAMARKAILEGGGFTVALKIVGEKAASNMREYIRSQPGDWPPLALSTILAKVKKLDEAADVKKLIDTGRLLKSITYEVVSK